MTTSKESDSLKALLSIASPPLGQQLVELPREFGHGGGSTEKDLAELLEQRNGFLAFEGALHVFPLGPGAEGYELMAWNSQELWRFAYDDMASDHLFFAEDVFGEQFSIRADRIWRFNPETGDSEDVAASLEHWAQGILQNYDLSFAQILSEFGGWCRQSPTACEQMARRRGYCQQKAVMAAESMVVTGQYVAGHSALPST